MDQLIADGHQEWIDYFGPEDSCQDYLSISREEWFTVVLYY